MNSLLLATQILVGITGYGDSSEFAEVVTNNECNLYVQWSRASNLLPETSNIMTSGLFDQAKAKGVHVMTIYGKQDGPTTKKLRETWGDLYLGNNIGEYAGFLYQDEKSYFKSWPRCADLKEAHDWDFPAKERSCADAPYPPNPRLDLWLRMVGRLFLCTPRAVKMIDGPDAKYVTWATYPDGTTYYLNSYCVKSRTITVDGKPMTLAPKEMRLLKQ